MTDDEIYAECEKVWKIKNTWGLSYADLIRCSYSNGAGGKGCVNGFDDRPEDTVYTSPSGSEMSRATCSRWIDDWLSFSHGFITAWKMRSND